MGVTLSGTGISSLLLPLYTYFLIENYGWRLAFVGLGALILLVIVPILYLFLFSVRDRQRRGLLVPTAPARPSTDWRRLVFTRPFLQMALAALATALVVPPLVISAAPVLVSGGLSRADAAGIVSLIGITSTAGRLAIGWTLDRIDGRAVAGFVVFLPTITCALLIWATGSVMAATVALLVLGLALGAEADLVAYLTSRYFPLANFGLLFGLLTGILALAGSGGPLLLSAVYDSTHSYVPALIAAIPLCPIAALLFVTLGPYPDQGTDAA
ncbi:MFS transporter [Sphingobium tyrosinilyticum]|uniref:MFS transporter n=1 Tax=Sphingobium tyrosinilyticum TaxID=2715436 RepID=A0ABV9F4I7_9SPHN